MSKLLLPLGNERKTQLRKLAAQRTLSTGEECDMTKLILEAVDSAIQIGPIASDARDASDPNSPTIIKVRLQPELAKAVQRARLNSGKPLDAVVNQALAEAFQLEVMA